MSWYSSCKTSRPHWLFSYFQFILFKKTVDLNLLENLEKFKSKSVKERVLVIVFWISKRINPIPNSTADNTKKKKVRERTLILSKVNPKIKEIEYRVIQRISAVSNKWAEVLVLTKRLKKIKKKNKKKIFKLSTIIEQTILWDSSVAFILKLLKKNHYSIIVTYVHS